MRLVDCARVIRSKNAGPTTLTLDLMFEDERRFRLAQASPALTPAALASPRSAIAHTTRPTAIVSRGVRPRTAMFPNAILRIAKADMDYWTNPEEEAKVPENQKARFIPAKRAVAAYGARIRPFSLGEELSTGIRSVDAAGHTPGHSCFMVQSGSARMLAIGDTIHVAPVQFPRPEITVAFDWDQAKARATRLSIFDTAIKEGIPLAAVHLPFPGIGRLRKNGDAYVFDPMPWQLF